MPGGRSRFGLVVAAAVAAGAAALVAACVPPVAPVTLEPGGTAEPTPAVVDRPWPMHSIDGRFRGANALGEGDVDGDGQVDLVTNYEFDQRYVVAFHPPAGADPRAPWPTVDLLPTTLQPNLFVDTENAALGDLDGDGNVDVVGAQGGHVTPFWEGYEPGIRVMWGPEPGAAADPTRWTDGRRIPATVEGGHYLWVQVRDLDGDGRADILAGGRVLFSNRARGGVIWLEGPDDPAERRDLSKWVRHDIDPDQLSGHGFFLGDLDADGDDDVVLANADFDTPEADEGVFWYENPGKGTPAQEQPWARHTIDLDPSFDPKPGLALADLDGDDRLDVVTQTAVAVYWYRSTGTAPVRFEKVVIPRDRRTRQFARPIRVGDVDGDGHLDLVGALVHSDGVLPGDEAAVFWMEYTGPTPTADNWVTHPIRFGSGRTMLLPAFGEKWDNMSLLDVDGDGDLDVAANVEEWWVNDGGEVAQWDVAGHRQSVGVVWFENTLDADRPAVAESDGLVVVEAESPTVTSGGILTPRNLDPGYGGTGYVQAFRTLSVALDPDTGAEEKLTGALAADRPGGDRHDVDVDGGTYTVWIRGRVPSAWGYAGGGAAADSVWMSVDGGRFAVVSGAAGHNDRWAWRRVEGTVDLAPGRHQLRLRPREPGFAVDQIVLSAGEGWSPPDGPVG